MWKCAHDEQGCSEDFLCIFCCYDLAVKTENLDEAESIVKAFPKMMEEKGMGTEHLKIDNKRKAKGLPPTPKQLAYIQSLAAQLDYHLREPDTLDEAKELIEELKAEIGVVPPSEKQINFLRKLAYERCGPSSEDWVQGIIKKGKKATSEEISSLLKT